VTEGQEPLDLFLARQMADICRNPTRNENVFILNTARKVINAGLCDDKSGLRLSDEANL
jgi:hypothetical protein